MSRCHEILLLLCLCLLLPASVNAVTLPPGPVLPRFEIVESLGTTHPRASLTVDPRTRQPSVAFIDTSALDGINVRAAPLRHRWFDGWAWRVETLGALAMTGNPQLDAPHDLLLARDGVGRRHVLAVEPNQPGFGDESIVYLRRDLAGFDVREELDTGAVSDPAFAVVAEGTAYSAWIRNGGASGGELVVRRRTLGGSAWIAVAIGARPQAVLSVKFAATVPSFPSNRAHLSWAELAANGEVHVRHASISESDVFETEILVIAEGLPGYRTHYVAGASDGHLEAAVLQPAGAPGSIALRRFLAHNGSVWSCPPGDCVFALPPVQPTTSRSRALALGSFGKIAFAWSQASAITQLAHADPLAGVLWQTQPIAAPYDLQDVVFDQSGNLYATAIDRSAHRDLLLVRAQVPWSSVRIPTFGTTLLASASESLAFTTERDGAPLIFARTSQDQGSGSGSVWSVQMTAFGESDFVRDGLPAGLDVRAADIAVGSDGRVHVALRDAITGQVFHAGRDAEPGSGWTVEQVSISAAGAAADPRIVLAKGLEPRVVYRQAGTLQIAAPLVGGGWLSRFVADSVGADARPRTVANREGHLVYVAWFHEQANELKVTQVVGNVADPTLIPRLRDLVVPYPAGWVLGASAHDIRMAGDGGIAVAYSESVGSQHRVGYSWYDLQNWVSPGSEPSVFGAPAILHIALDARLGAANTPRVSWVQGSNTATQTLHFAEKFPGQFNWAVESLGSYPENSPVLALSSAASIRIAYAENGELRMARRNIALDPGVTAAAHEVLPARSSAVAFCICLIFGNVSGWAADDQPCDPQIWSGSPPFIAQLANLASSANDAPDPLPLLRARFGETAAGRYYLQLFTEHAVEIIGLTLSDPTRLAQRMRTLDDLTPGLTAFIAGDGSDFVFTPDLIAGAREIWLGWAAAGSPELAAAVAAELARTDDLNAFSGKSFDEWFSELEVGTATQRIFADGFD